MNFISEDEQSRSEGTGTLTKRSWWWLKGKKNEKKKIINFYWACRSRRFYFKEVVVDTKSF